jgi:urease accessory protein UreF
MSDQARIQMITAKLAELDGAIERDQGNIDMLKEKLIASEGSEAMIAADVALQNARAAHEAAREQMHEQNGHVICIRAVRAEAAREIEKLEQAEMHLGILLNTVLDAAQRVKITEQHEKVQVMLEAQETIKREAEQNLAMNTDFVKAITALHAAEQTLHQARDAYESAHNDWTTNDEYRSRIQCSYAALLQSQEKLIEQRTILKQELIA